MTLNDNHIHIWLRTSLIVLVLMVLIGGITRLTQSGLSITTWKPIMGVVPPLNDSDWNIHFNEYKKSPDFIHNNFSISLKEYKIIYFWEFLHRFLGRMIGLLFMLPFTYFCYKGYLTFKDKLKYLFLLILGITQGFMGWYMVKSGLVDVPYISHYRLAAHLILAFIIIAFTYWMDLNSSVTTKVVKKKKKSYNIFMNIIISVFLLQVMYGAFASAFKLGESWNTFPLINNSFIPEGLFSIKPFLHNFFENKLTLQFIHRYLGITLASIISIFCYYIRKTSNKSLIINSQYMLTIVLLQFLLGIITLISSAPIILSASHQFLAVLLLLSIVKTKHSINYISKTI